MPTKTKLYYKSASKRIPIQHVKPVDLVGQTLKTHGRVGLIFVAASQRDAYRGTKRNTGALEGRLGTPRDAVSPAIAR